MLLAKIAFQTLTCKPHIWRRKANMSHVFFCRLLSDAEILENIAQDLVGGDLSGNFAQVVQYFTNILCQEVGGKMPVKPFGSAQESPGGRFERIVVTDVGNDHILVFDGSQVNQLKEHLAQAIDVLSRFSGDRYDSFIFIQGDTSFHSFICCFSGTRSALFNTTTSCLPP